MSELTFAATKMGRRRREESLKSLKFEPRYLGSYRVLKSPHMIAIYFMHDNFCRIHQTLRVTPAMEAGIADHVWDLSEVVALIDENSK